MTLALALALDAIFGEPRWLWSRLPHPIVLLGRLVAWGDKTLNRGPMRRAKGVLFLVGLLSLSGSIGLVFTLLPWPLQAVLAAILLAQRSLAQHVAAVADGLRMGRQEGRRAVAMIVGRDTQGMDEGAIARAAIESAAENLSDGVVAPAFWFALGGLPAMLAYKALNTADSMVGYLTPKHAEFGWASARLDDLANWVPARLTALLILAVHAALPLWPEVTREAPRHRSPNAGWPESAVARAQGIALSGPRAYGGEMREFPFVNPGGRRALGPRDIDASIAALWKTWSAIFAIVVLGALLVF
ncbi:MAG: adenosylcobinamide-phosphate synthase CbiB [Pseudomonadota bacterium]